MITKVLFFKQRESVFDAKKLSTGSLTALHTVLSKYEVNIFCGLF